MARKEKNYWGEKQEALCKQWLTADTRQQFVIYEKLKPAMNYLVHNIMQKYFIVPLARQLEVQEDCIQHIYVKLKQYEPQRQKAYTFCGTVARNWLFEEIIRIPNTLKNAQIEYTDEDDSLDRVETGIDYGSPRKIDFKAISDHFISISGKTQQLINSLDRRYEKDTKHTKYDEYNYKRIRKKYEKQQEVCRLSIEFMMKFESINANNMAEYCYLNSDLNRRNVVLYFHTLFNLNVTILSDERDTQGKYVDGYNMFNDDFTPDEIIGHRRRYMRIKKEKFKKDSRYNYF